MMSQAGTLRCTKRPAWQDKKACQRFRHNQTHRLKAMVPPVVFPRPAGKALRIVLPEDKCIRKFNSKHPGSLTEEAFWFNGYDPPPACVFAWRISKLMNDGVIEEEATAIADMEYKAEKQAKRKAYARLKEIARLEGKKPPPIPY
ncbi:hypothetical protein SUGI_0990690 [Cryptomeria japonica]|nr:hypothetical protein SUGI_0990690 [Cryptomeria japonica]